MLESLYSQEKVDELREYEAEQRGIGIGEVRGEKKGEAKSFWSLVHDKIITKVTVSSFALLTLGCWLVNSHAYALLITVAW